MTSLYIDIRKPDEVIIRIFDTMFSRMKVGEIVKLDEIIGGVSYDKV